MQHKLVSPKGTLLGTVTIPDTWSDNLFKGRSPYFSAAVMPKISWEVTATDVAPLIANKITLMRAYFSEYSDAVCLVEGTIEEFEKLPGCFFAPSMQFLRSQIEASQI